MIKRTVAVFFGSRSAEHDVSIITAIAAIIKPLTLSKQYDVIPVYIAKDGKWYSDPLLADVATYSGGKIDSVLSKLSPIAVQFNDGLTLIKPSFKNKTIKVDIAFPATHGTYGEDGDLMGIFEMAGIPYVGCGVSASVLAMDKVLARIAADYAGVELNKYEWFFAHQFLADQAAVLEQLSVLEYPLFVKPTHLGSSIAITRVTNKTELVNAIEVAAHYDDKIIVEEAVQNLIEVTVPIMGNSVLTAGNTEEPVQGEGFFDFETKYMRGGKKGGAKVDQEEGSQGYSHIPARLSDDMQERCISVAKNVYRALGCSGIARVDLLIDSKTSVIYFNEANPLPGSLYAHNWRTIGISSIELVQQLIVLADERHAERERYVTVFQTNFLSRF